METTATEIRKIRPLVLRARGGWLAVSEPGSPLAIGVRGQEPEQVESRFTQALEAWAALAEG